LAIALCIVVFDFCAVNN